MSDSTVLHLVTLAQKGDNNAREKLILKNRPFIYKTSCSVCKRSLSWENDDELSIALIAFNEAINSYDSQKGANFFTFARRVINLRLIDFFRHEKRHKHLPLAGTTAEEESREESLIECSLAWEDHRAKSEQEELAEIMLEFEERLKEFNTSLDELVDSCPRHKDTRENLAQVARVLCDDQLLLDALYKKKKIPAKKLARAARVSKKVLENGRKYIIALVIIISEEKFAALKSFIFP